MSTLKKASPKQAPKVTKPQGFHWSKLALKPAMARSAANGQKTQVRIAVDPSQVPRLDDKIGRWTAVGQVHPRYGFLVDGATEQECLATLLTRGANPFGFSAVQPAAIWVQESFVQGFEMDPVTTQLITRDANENPLPPTTWYRAAVGSDFTWSDDDGSEAPVPWRAATQMPFELSRTWLKVESLVLAKLSDITDEEIKAEGVVPQGDETLTEAFIRHWDAKARFDQQWNHKPLVWVATVSLMDRPVSQAPAKEAVAA